MSVAITRLDMLPGELRREASRLKDARAARRVLAVALVLEGSGRTHAAKACGMDRQTLRDWVHRYNVEGIGGLFNRRPVGRKARLGAEQKAKIAGLVGWPRSGQGRCRALAAHRSQEEDRGPVRRHDARAHGRQAAGGAGLCAPVDPAAAPRVRSRRAGDF